MSKYRLYTCDLLQLSIQVLHRPENGSSSDDSRRRQSRSFELHVGTVRCPRNLASTAYAPRRYHGGWLAPNIYYLGGSGCVRLNGIRIAGASGIFKNQDYNLGHFERIPYDNSALRSVYHVRAYDVLKLSLLSPGPEIFISHDWPEGIYRYGDTAALLNTKPFFKQDIAKGELGNPHMMDVLKALKPSWWFSAHLHVRFQAEYDHIGEGVSDWGKVRGGARSTPISAPKNADEIVMGDSDTEAPISVPERAAQPRNMDEERTIDSTNDIQVPSTDLGSQSQSIEGSSSQTRLPSTTKFLALDKCLPRRKFLEVCIRFVILASLIIIHSPHRSWRYLPLKRIPLLA
jgi:lariat debranching enzyme